MQPQLMEHIKLIMILLIAIDNSIGRHCLCAQPMLKCDSMVRNVLAGISCVPKLKCDSMARNVSPCIACDNGIGSI